MQINPYLDPFIDLDRIIHLSFEYFSATIGHFVTYVKVTRVESDTGPGQTNQLYPCYHVSCLSTNMTRRGRNTYIHGVGQNTDFNHFDSVQL